MKSVMDINDIWDALEARTIWQSVGKAQKAKAKQRSDAVAKLKALTGGAG